jgi:CheY-like chemotaxis protein
MTLERLGCRVDVAGNGKEAVAMADEFNYDIIFMDCEMPVMDGFEATAAIRRQQSGRSLPIVAMTARALRGDREKCLESGMDDYLPKPAYSEDFAAMIKKWLRSDDVSGMMRDGQELAKVVNAPRPAPSPLDDAAIKRLCSLVTDKAELADLFETFIAEAQSSLAAIKRAAQSASAEDLRKEAHKLKGASANLGVPGLVAICRQIEETARGGLAGGVYLPTDQLAEEIDRVRESLSRILK